MGLKVSCDETDVVLMLLDIKGVSCDCGLDDLKGTGCHCFEDGLSKEWGWGEHTESIEVGISVHGGSEGAEGVGANGCCGDDVSCWLGGFGLGGNGGVDIEGNDLGVGAQPQEGRQFVGRVDGRSPQNFEVVEEYNLLLVVRNKDWVVILVQILHLGVHGGVVIIASVNFLALRLPIAFPGANPCRKCVFQEGESGIVG